MDFFNESLKEKTGASKFAASMNGFYLSAKHDFQKYFSRSRHARLRSGIAVLTLAALVSYGLKKNSVDSHLEKLRHNIAERVEYKRIERDEKRALKVLDETIRNHNSLQMSIAYLKFQEDSLSGVVNNLSRNVSSSSLQAEQQLSSLNSQIGYLRNVKDSLERVVVNYASAARSAASTASRNASNTASNTASTTAASTASSYESVQRSNNSGVSSTNVRNISQNIRGVIGSNQVWVQVPPGSSLSDIARLYYGDASKFKDIAVLNGLDNPDHVLRMQPIALDKSALIYTNDVMSGEVPSFIQVLRRETIDDFMNRTRVKASLSDVLSFNEYNGNSIQRNSLMINNTDVVYLKSEWLK